MNSVSQESIPSRTSSPGASAAGATRALANHVSTLTYEQLPPSLITLLKKCVLDTLGVSIAASSIAAEAKLVADYVMAFEGKPESSILGFGGKAPAAWAVFVNGSLGHMADYDDIVGTNHVSIATIPVAFAIAEKVGRVSGRDFLTAVAAGTDLHTRIDLSIDLPDWTMSEGWFSTQLLGCVSGSATAARLMQLTPDETENALGIGFNQMSGSRQMAVGVATHMRSMQAGFSGHASVVAAELAQRGVIGCKEIIEGRYGFFKNFVRTNTPRWEVLTGDLGRSFPLLECHGFKVWPACAYTRITNTAALELLQKYDLSADDIEAVRIIGGSAGIKLLSEPIESKRRPQTSIDGKFSVPFTTAVMLVKGNVTLRDYMDTGLNDQAVLSMADRITYEDAPAGDVSCSRHPIVQITTRGGRTLSSQPDGVPGDPAHPVDWPMLESKFRDCVGLSRRAVEMKQVERAIECIKELENMKDVAEVIRLLVPQ
jgi:2-methylcitrate dehydratase PrpD